MLRAMTLGYIGAIIGLILIIVGIVRLVQADILWGIILIVIGIVLGGGGFLI